MTKASSLVARMQATNEKGGRSMWVLAFADAALLLLARPEQSLTKAELIDLLKSRKDGLEQGSLLQNAYDEALSEVMERTA